MPELVALGLGANLGDRAGQIARALHEIERRSIGAIVAVSSLWRTAPWGLAEQPPFLNACAVIETRLAPHALLAAIKQIEFDLGRRPTLRWGPRVIDMDILLYGQRALSEPDLTIPHRDLLHRGFVLAPLAEIAPDMKIGALSVGEALARTDRSGLAIEQQGADWFRRARGDEGMGETIQLKCKDGVAISAYRARPEGAPRGGVVVLQEIFGVNHHIRAVADRFAAAGYLAVAPALFDRVERDVELGYGQEDRPRAMDLRGSAKLEATLLDMDAAIGAAKEGGKVALVGYCWGGTLAFVGACRLAGIAAAVGYYGGGIAGVASERPRVPLMLHFGAHDKHIPLRDVDRIKTMQPEVPVFVYDADHGFNCDERESYNAAAADQARLRTMEFLSTELK